MRVTNKSLAATLVIAAGCSLGSCSLERDHADGGVSSSDTVFSACAPGREVEIMVVTLDAFEAWWTDPQGTDHLLLTSPSGDEVSVCLDWHGLEFVLRLEGVGVIPHVNGLDIVPLGSDHKVVLGSAWHDVQGIGKVVILPDPDGAVTVTVP